jgi:4-hydroxy-3-polyprenylbenzoate decarboxylase
VANCFGDELVARAGAVCLKERRRVVLLRETQLHACHIELMAAATRKGTIIMPPEPTFYHRSAMIDDIANQDNP